MSTNHLLNQSDGLSRYLNPAVNSLLVLGNAVIDGTLSVSGGIITGPNISVDNISQYTLGHGVDVLNPLNVDVIGGYTSHNNVTIGDISFTANTISSTGTNQNLNLSATGSGGVVISNPIFISGTLEVDTILGKTSPNNITLGNLQITSGTVSTSSVLSLNSGSVIDVLKPLNVDNIQGLTLASSLNVGNLAITSNTLSSTGTNQNLSISATGSGSVNVTSTLKTDIIEGFTTTASLTMGNLAISSNTIASTGTNQTLNINSTGSGNVTSNGSIQTNKNFIIPATTASVGQIVQNGGTIFQTYGTNNIFIGNNSGNYTNTGSSDIAIGDNIMPALSSGINNLGLGSYALNAVTSGGGNVGIGSSTLAGVTTGSSNTAIGVGAMNANTITGSLNVAGGASALQGITTGSRNTCIGTSGLASLTTGSNNTIIGYQNASAYTGAETNNTILGYAIPGTVGESNVMRLGNTSTATTYINGIYGQNLGSMANLVGITSTGLIATQATQLNTYSQLNTLATGGSYKIAGNTVIDQTNMYITNGSFLATLNNSAGTATCTYTLPSKPAGTYTLATTNDVSGAYASYMTISASTTTSTTGGSSTIVLTPTLTANVTALNFTNASNTLLTYTGTPTLVCNVSGSVSFSLLAIDSVQLLLYHNGSSIGSSNLVTSISGSTMSLSVNALFSLATSDTIQLYYQTASNQTITTSAVSFNVTNI